MLKLKKSAFLFLSIVFTYSLYCTGSAYKDTTDPLAGLQIIWLGSSVTYGAMAKGYSMADYLNESHKGLISKKFAVSGTTLIDKDNDRDKSYVDRMKMIPADIQADFFIVQLSTNDALINPLPLGTLGTSKDINDFDTKTIYGAIQYIIAYASATWKCPVVFYTGTYFEAKDYYNMTASAEQYSQMVDALHNIQKKWNIEVIDLYNDSEMRKLYNTDHDQYKIYMADGVHPSRTGYTNWWGPKFEKALRNYITSK